MAETDNVASRRHLPRRDVRYAAFVLCAGAVGVLVRIGFALGFREAPSGDGAVFAELARSLADGAGYSVVVDGVETADSRHPPLLPLVLAAADLAGVHSVQGWRIVLAVLGGVGIVAIAGVGRTVGGRRAGLGVAVIAAVHPIWIQPGGVLFAEPLYLTLVSVILLAGLRVRRHRSASGALVLGALIGLAALTRSEAILLTLVAGVAVFGAPKRESTSRGALLFGCVLIGVAATVTPWLIRNMTVFGTPAMSSNLGVTLAGANCEEVYPEGDQLGGWSLRCAVSVVDGHTPDEHSEIDQRARERAIEFVRERAGDYPVVATARLGRMWGLYAAEDQLQWDSREGQRHVGVQRAGQLVHWTLFPLTIIGIAILWARRRTEAVMVLVPIAVALIVAVGIYGSTRMRSVAEPSIAVFAAVAIVAVHDRVSGRIVP